MPRFSDEELHGLRNKILVSQVMEVLNIPTKLEDQMTRFLCPICNEFQTALNPRVNLARCFRCEKNFNTIDLVMLDHKLDFVTAVKFLKQRFLKLLGVAESPVRALHKGSSNLSIS